MLRKVNRQMVKVGVDYIWKLSDMAFQSKEEITQCKNYRCISLRSMVGNIYVVKLGDRIRRMMMSKGGFRSGKGCVVQIFTNDRQIGEKKRRVHVGFMDLEKTYDRVKREI